MSESPYYPYPPRPGTHTESLSLDTKAKGILTEQEREEVLAFERDLYNLNLNQAEFPSAEAYRELKDDQDTPVEPFEKI